MAPYTTNDGHQLNDLAVRALIGTSLPTPAACAAAVAQLRAALLQGITYDALWHLARHLVWGTSPQAISSTQPVIAPGPAPAPPSPRAPLAWSDEITWDDDEAPPSLGPALPTSDNDSATRGAPTVGQPTQLSLHLPDGTMQPGPAPRHRRSGPVALPLVARGAAE